MKPRKALSGAPPFFLCPCRTWLTGHRPRMSLGALLSWSCLHVLGMELVSQLASGMRVAIVLLATAAGMSLLLLLGSMYLSKARCFWNRMPLLQVQDPQQGYTAPTYPPTLIGQQGTTQTPLRPAGKVRIKGLRYDAISIGTYMPPGTAVVVTEVAGSSLVVQAIALA